MTARSTTIWALATAASACALLSCGSEVTNEDPALLHGRAWFAKMPEKPTEHVHAFVVIARPKRGVFSNSSAYDLHLELFEYARENNNVKLKFPQTEKKAEFSYTIKACDAEPFDLCLDLDKNPWGGPKRYYGKRSDELDGDLAARSALLRAAPAADDR
jgi:hypothetical protein